MNRLDTASSRKLRVFLNQRMRLASGSSRAPTVTVRESGDVDLYNVIAQTVRLKVLVAEENMKSTADSQ